MGFAVQKGPGRVLRRDSEKGVSRRCPERPLGEYDHLGVRPLLFCRHENLLSTQMVSDSVGPGAGIGVEILRENAGAAIELADVGSNGWQGLFAVVSRVLKLLHAGMPTP